MTNKGRFSARSRLKSFTYAFNGLKLFLLTGHNAWVQITIAIFVLCAGIYYHISVTEWCLVILSAGLVLSAEACNTAIELLTDLVTPEYNEKAKLVKDMAAGAVLLISLFAFLIGLIIFVPRLMAW